MRTAAATSSRAVHKRRFRSRKAINQPSAFSRFRTARWTSATSTVSGPGAISPVLLGRVAVARAAEVPEGAARYFAYPAEDDQAVLLHLPGNRFVAYSQVCTHLSCAVYYQAERGRLYCPCHEGVFDPLTGEPVAGPPQRPLPRIVLREENGTLYAVGREP